MAKFATVQAIVEFVAASIRFLKAFRKWDPTWVYHANDPCFLNGVGYCANPANVPKVNESPETHPAKWNVIGGSGGESGGTYIPTPNRAAKFDPDARIRSGGYAVEPYHAVRKKELNLRATSLQFYSRESLLVSNARQALRRLRGWDLGVPYISQFSEVYHFDTDLLSQKQQAGISVAYAGEAPRLVGKEHIFAEEIAAMKGVPPYEAISKSLLGNFRVEKTLPASENCTVEFWARILSEDSFILFRVGTAADSVSLRIGLADPEYSKAESGDPRYSAGGSAGVEYSAARTGDVLEHQTQNGTALTIAVETSRGAWLHFAVVNTRASISVFVGERRFDFQKHSYANMPLTAIVNENLSLLDIDELFFDPVAALSFAAFAKNTEARIPYAALDCNEKWLILEAEDVEKVKTNLFETGAFRAAVEAVVNNM